MATWTTEAKAAAVAKLLATIQDNPVPMAVVDYGLGWRRTGASGRYGVRDLRHVSIYRLEVVSYNWAAMDRFEGIN